MNTRLIAVKIIEEVYEKEHFLKDVFDGYLHIHDFERHEKAFLNKLVYGTVEQQIKIDYIINQFSKVKTNKLKPFIYYVLSISVYQLLEMTQVPASAVCNEAVKLVKKRNMHSLAGFVNGVLRNISREMKYIQYPDESKNPSLYIHTIYSLPLWLVELLMNQYDYESVKLMAEDSILPPDLSIRVNSTKMHVKTLQDKLISQGINVTEGHMHEQALRIKGAINLNECQLFNAGNFIVQDESSMMVATILNPSKDDYILDLCAAPGGKSTHLAEMAPLGRVEARDISERKINFVKENADKLGLTNIDTKIWDGTIMDPVSTLRYDAVVIDAPCSGLGIIKKKPDIKRNMDAKRIENLLAIQKELLKNGSKYVKIGGSLLYSTCTVNKQENQEQIDKFLEDNPEFVKEDIRIENPLDNMLLENGYLQMLPIKNLTDGFFIAKLNKVDGI